MQTYIKRCVKLGISVIWLCASWCVDNCRRLIGRPARGSAILFYYHGIRPRDRAGFARQMDILLRWARPIHADSRTALDARTRFAGVTFDDGLKSFADSALPELKRRGIPATLFVIADRLGCYPDWPGFVPDPEFSEPLLTLEQLQELPTELITLGSHTMTHPTLTQIDEAVAREEIRQSRERLERTLGRKIALFSFPHGAHNQRLIESCRESGYERVYTILPGPAFVDPHEYTVGRVSVEPTDWTFEFWLKLMGAYSWLPAAFQFKRWLLTLAAGAPGKLRPNAT